MRNSDWSSDVCSSDLITTEDWTEESTQSATGPDIAIKPLGFGMVEHIGHEAPEHRYRKQVEHRYPDEKRAAAPGKRLLKRPVKEQQIGRTSGRERVGKNV